MSTVTEPRPLSDRRTLVAELSVTDTFVTRVTTSCLGVENGDAIEAEPVRDHCWP